MADLKCCLLKWINQDMKSNMKTVLITFLYFENLDVNANILQYSHGWRKVLSAKGLLPWSQSSVLNNLSSVWCRWKSRDEMWRVDMVFPGTKGMWKCENERQTRAGTDVMRCCERISILACPLCLQFSLLLTRSLSLSFSLTRSLSLFPSLSPSLSISPSLSALCDSSVNKQHFLLHLSLSL